MTGSEAIITPNPAFISIGELINASIPKTGKILQQLHNNSSSKADLTFVKVMIESQVFAGADYIAVNLDALGKNNPNQVVDMISEYIGMVHKWGYNVPICIDSDNNKVLMEGLKKWYETGSYVRPPLLSAIKHDTMDDILAMRKDYDFGVVFLLNEKERSAQKDFRKGRR